MSEIAKRGFNSVAGGRVWYFLRPAAYALDATHLILQDDLIQVEKNALKKRAKLLDKLIKKLEKIFADRSGGRF